MKTLALAVLILSITLSPVYAAEKWYGEKLNWVMTSVHDEQVKCWDYYGIAEEFAKISGEIDVADQFKQIADAMSQKAIITGKLINIKDEATIAKLKFVHESFKKLLDNNPSNYPLLIEKHKDSCKQIFENAIPRIDYYANQYEKKFEN